MQKKQKDYGSIFWIHLLINLIFIFSWLLFSWLIIVIGEIVLQLQYWLLGGCIFSKAEFGHDEACMPYYLKKWRFIKNKKKARKFIRYYLPIIVIAISLVWQILLNHNPLIF